MLPRRESLLSLAKLINVNSELPGNFAFLQFVRWRKRAGTPRAPSKMYYVREPTPKDPVEMAELMKLNNNYKTSVRAIRSFLLEERQQEAKQQKSYSLRLKEEQEFSDLLEENRIWNEHAGREREQFFSNLRESERSAQLAKIAEIEEMNQEKLQDREEEVRLQKEQSSSFISERDLDEMIDIALNTRNDYNFALDLEGNKLQQGKMEDSTTDMAASDTEPQSESVDKTQTTL